MHLATGPFTRRAVLLGQDGRELPAAEVRADDLVLTNAANLVAWDGEPVQLVVCDCASPFCAQGNVVSIRALGGGRLLLLPAFEALARGDPRGGPQLVAQCSPPDFLEHEAWLLDLEGLAGTLPELVAIAPGLRPPSAAELVRLVQWEAPDRALGDPAAPPTLGRDVVEVAADGEPAARVVELLHALLREEDRRAALREAGPGDVPITCFVDGTGSGWHEWSPMASTPAGLRLRLEPGWIVEPPPNHSTRRQFLLPPPPVI